MPHYLTLTPRDPLIARDGRPFGANAGNRMRSLDWLYPSVLAGSLRTLLGKQNGGFNPETVKKLKALAVSGPFPRIGDSLFFPRPLDCVVREEIGKRACFGVRPAHFDSGEGCDLPIGLRPVLLSDGAGCDFKPAKLPGFWSAGMLAAWLANPTGGGFDSPPESATGSKEFLDLPPEDSRTHVKMDPASGVGAEGELFSTTGLVFTTADGQPLQMAARVEESNDFDESLTKLDCLHPLGGERRLAHWRRGQSASAWTCPGSIVEALKGAQLVRMVLATPAIFKAGWKPGWLDQGEHGLEGTPPGSSVKLRLAGVVADRWQPISGWSLEPPAGPKAIRRMVPAGGVYFFEVLEGEAGSFTERWLHSVCDDEQDRRDGFGLALFGIWNAHDSNEKGAS